MVSIEHSVIIILFASVNSSRMLIKTYEFIIAFILLLHTEVFLIFRTLDKISFSMERPASEFTILSSEVSGGNYHSS